MKGNSGLKKLVLLDKGYDAFIKKTKAMAKPLSLTVGVHAGPGSAAKEVPEGAKPSPVTVLDVAQWMEFGTATIPARSFIRAWADENRAECQVQIAAAMRAVMRGSISQTQAMELLGLKFVGSIQARIANNIPPPLAQSTIDRKGSSVALIDTGQLRSAITSQVKGGGGPRVYKNQYGTWAAKG
jgi:hypothetical protein